MSQPASRGWGNAIVNGSFLIIGIIFVAVNAYLLGHGAAKWGYSDIEKYAYGIVGGSTAVVLALLPTRLNLSWKDSFFGLKRPSSGTFVLAALWTLFIAFNVVNGGGTIAFARQDVIAARTHEADTAGAVKEKRNRLAQEVKALPDSRPAATLPPLIAAAKSHKAYSLTDGCQEDQMTNNWRRKACGDLRALEAEHATAVRRAEINKELDKLDLQMRGTSMTASAAADPQVDMIHELSCSAGNCFDKASIGLWLPVMVPVVLEAGACSLVHIGLAGFGLTFGASTRRKPDGGGTAPDGPPKPILVNRDHMVAVESRITSEELRDRRKAADTFFSQWAVPSPSGALSEREWWEHYEHYCRLINATPVTLESFRRIAMGYVGSAGLVDGEYVYMGVLPIMPKELRKSVEAAE